MGKREGGETYEETEIFHLLSSFCNDSFVDVALGKHV